MGGMFVTFYDKKSKARLAFMVEMSCIPCIGDSVVISKRKYKVADRIFSIDKPYRCACYVE